MEKPLELFKLEPIDRKVFFWLLDHTSRAMVSSWIEYIATDYNRRGVAKIDPVKFLLETYESSDVDQKEVPGMKEDS
jgi:hypothetical protein